MVVGCMEARSKQLASRSVSLGLEGNEGGNIIGYSGSPSTCTSRSTSNRKSSDSDEYEQALLRSMSSSYRESENTEDWSSVSKTQSAGMLERGGGLRDEDEAGVCGAREWKEVGEVGKREERWFSSLEEDEERMEDEADEERTSVGMGGGG